MIPDKSLRFNFPAPWGIEVQIMTIGGSLVCLGLPLFFRLSLALDSDSFAVGFLQAPSILWLVCFLHTIRGYTVCGDSLFIHRLIWSTRIPLAGLESVDTDTNPFHRTIRLFGNPGIFGVSGLYYNRSLGRFRAFVTDKSKSCVLRFSSGSIALSPCDHRRFLKALLNSIERQG